MIPDLTEAEIDAFFADQGEMEIALMKSTSAPTFSEDLTRYMVDSNVAEDKQLTSKAAISSRCGLPMSKPQLEQLRMNGIPEKTREQAKWCVRVWKDWALERNAMNGEVFIPLEFVEAARKQQLCAYMCYFAEIRQIDGEEYPPQTLYQLCCSLQRAAHFAGLSSLNLFEDPQLQKFQLTLDAEMKHLASKGKG